MNNQLLFLTLFQFRFSLPLDELEKAVQSTFKHIALKKRDEETKSSNKSKDCLSADK
jgi:hypothetical protein